jgi:hypothetical protein
MPVIMLIKQMYQKSSGGDSEDLSLDGGRWNSKDWSRPVGGSLGEERQVEIVHSWSSDCPCAGDKGSLDRRNPHQPESGFRSKSLSRSTLFPQEKKFAMRIWGAFLMLSPGLEL